MRHPEVGGGPGALAAAATVLGSAIRLSEEGGKADAAWRLMACEPRPVKKAHSLFRFDDGITPRIFGGEAAFENQIGQFVAVSWKSEDALELRAGWAWEHVTAMHRMVLSTEDDEPFHAHFYEIQFEERMAVSLRKFLKVSEEGMEPLLRRIADMVLASGLVSNPGPDAYHYHFEKGESSPWTPTRMDQHAIRFTQAPLVNVLGFSIVAPGGRILADKIGLSVSRPASKEPLRLMPPVLSLWDLAQSLAMAHTLGSTGLPS